MFRKQYLPTAMFPNNTALSPEVTQPIKRALTPREQVGRGQSRRGQGKILFRNILQNGSIMKRRMKSETRAQHCHREIFRIIGSTSNRLFVCPEKENPRRKKRWKRRNEEQRRTVRAAESRRGGDGSGESSSGH